MHIIPLTAIEPLLQRCRVQKSLERKGVMAHCPFIEGTDASISFKGKCHYRGYVQRGLLHGEGRWTWPDGSKYQGEFSANRIEGQGTLSSAGNAIYEGGFAGGKREGKGTLKKGDDLLYRGEFHQDLFSGTGELTVSPLYSYKGEFFQGAFHGNGVLRFQTTQAVYEGQFVGGHIEGRGKMHWPLLRESYQGDWLNGRFSGNGLHLFKAESLSKSVLCDEFFSGEFSEGRCHGFGVRVFTNGVALMGNWVRGRKEGELLHRDPGGEMSIRVYKNDHFVQAKPLRRVYSFLLNSTARHRETFETVVAENAVLRASHSDSLKKVFESLLPPDPFRLKAADVRLRAVPFDAVSCWLQAKGLLPQTTSPQALYFSFCNSDSSIIDFEFLASSPGEVRKIFDLLVKGRQVAVVEGRVQPDIPLFYHDFENFFFFTLAHCHPLKTLKQLSQKVAKILDGAVPSTEVQADTSKDSC